MAEKKWKIDILPPFGGFAPAYWEETYPYYGNKNMAGDMTDCDITSPDRMTQGPGLSNLTNGTDAGEVTTLINHILHTPSSNDVSWAIGGSKLYKISSTAVASGGGYPHTIDKAVVTGEDGESVVYSNDYLYYFYNHSGGAGDFGRLTVSTDTFDDDYGSTTPTGASGLQNAPHPAILGGDGYVYFGNGRYVGYYDPITDTLSAEELDFYPDVEVVDLVWEKNAIWVATNAPNIASGNSNRGVIYVWDTRSSSFQEPIIEVPGRLGALFVKNGRIFVFYQDLSSTGGFKLGYIVGDTVQELAGFTGSLPQFGQVTHYKNMISFVSDGKVYLWGATTNKMPVALSQYMDCGYATAGALGTPFGEILVASDNGAGGTRIAKQSGYSTNTTWKTIMYDVATSVLDKVKIYYYPTAAGAQLDLGIRYNRDGSTVSLADNTISHANDGSNLSKSFFPKQELDEFRLELDWSNGSSANPLAIRKIEVEGHLVDKD